MTVKIPLEIFKRSVGKGLVGVLDEEAEADGVVKVEDNEIFVNIYYFVKE